MRLTVFGATGRIGAHVVRQALDSGHHVTAVVRDPARLSLSDPALEVFVTPGLTHADALVPALKGSDAAISGVGPMSRRDVTVASSTVRGILGALEASGVRRFVAVTAAPIGPVPEDDSWLNRRVLLPTMSAILRPVYDDLRVMEEEIRRTGTEWTVVRPPRLTDRPLSRRYRAVVGGNVPRGYLASRADVAHCMLAVLTDPATVHTAVGIAN